MAAKPSSKLKSRAIGIAIFAVVALVIAFAAARFATLVTTHHIGSINRFMAASGPLMSDLAASPLAVDFTLFPARAAFLGTLAAVALIAFIASQKGEKLENEDTGAEHGDDRLATDAEMRSLSDKRHFSNNVLYSEHCHLAMQPCDKRTKAILDGRNLNCITLGISGLGKTYNLVWPDLMQSVGAALEPAPYGIRNVPAHLVRTRFYKTLSWAASLLTHRQERPVEAAAEEPRRESEEAQQQASAVAEKRESGIAQQRDSAKEAKQDSGEAGKDASEIEEKDGSAKASNDESAEAKKQASEQPEKQDSGKADNEDSEQAEQRESGEAGKRESKEAQQGDSDAAEKRASEATEKQDSEEAEKPQSEKAQQQDSEAAEQQNSAIAEKRDAASAAHVGRKGPRERLAALAESYREAVGEGNSRSAREKAEAAIKGGYDVFNTDPKGDNVRDIGAMYERAGYEVKVVNTIDFNEGLHVNPLAYIKSHAVDSRPVEETRVKVTASAPAAPKGDPIDVVAGADDDAGRLAPGCMKVASAVRPGIRGEEPAWVVEASYDMSTQKWGAGDVPETASSREDLDAALIAVGEKIDAAAEAGDDAAVAGLMAEQERLLEQMNMWWMRHEMGDFTSGAGSEAASSPDARVAGNGCSGVADALSAFTYRRSSGTIEVKFKSYQLRPVSAAVTVELDDALVVDSVLSVGNGWIEWPRDESGDIQASGTLVWHLEDVAGKRPVFRGEHAKAPEENVAVGERLLLHVHVKTETVADGVDLTKIVDCLVSNLRGTDAQSNGSEDPFWEDTKRLCFMSLVAFTFERYGPAYRTLPEVMRLLDMALPDTGNPEDPSPLKCLMEQWEYGRVYSAAAAPEQGRFAAPSSSWAKADNVGHSRNTSLALHCYHAFMNGAPETVQSVIISCQACLVNLVSDDVKEFLRYDELALDTLGDPGQKQVIFCVTKDTNSPFDFITALVVYLAIDLAQDKAYKVYGGRLPRHVRFVLDEAANIGKIPILIRALAVVRSRNISISMYLQSKAQLALVYGEKEADVIFDNCTTIVYLGAQTEETREEMSKRVGTETVQSRRFQRSFNGGSVFTGSTSESISSNERRVVSASKMGKLEKGYLMLFIFNAPGAIFDHKYRTRRHPLYAYINPTDKRTWLEPLPKVAERFDYMDYLRRKREGEAAMDG